jgi:hypothetical protein
MMIKMQSRGKCSFACLVRTDRIDDGCVRFESARANRRERTCAFCRRFGAGSRARYAID